jgi:eukaryotic-like serine/threonine-protein kinase
MSHDTKPSSPGPATMGTAGAPTVRIALPDPPGRSDGADAERVTRYRAHGMLGRGGMGEVRLVEDGLIGREVAVKTIVSGLADSRTIRDRFLREVRIQGQLEHPSIVPVYDLGVDELGNDYFTMKRIAGRTLASVLRALASGDAPTVHAFPRNSLLAVFRQVCLAIAYAHSRGVIHRDLKPANVMVGDFGEVYVLDWGIAWLVDELPNQDGEHLLGTPGYMAPEQLADANDVDERSDVYSLGAILFEVLALEPWHPASNVAEAIASTMSEHEARPAQRAPQRDIPPELDDVCARATATRREDRVQTARELAEVVERYLEGDRDLARRRQQAQVHARAARVARERVAAGGPDAVVARREALREAGRAVALDPEGREGLRAAVELMLEPPVEVPHEVKADLERAQSDRIRAGIAPGIVVFATFLLVALIVPAVLGPISWLVPGVIAGALAIAIVLCVLLLRKADLSSETSTTLAIAACAAVAIAFASGYLGPMMIIPPLAVALGNALATSQLKWRAFVAFSILGVVVPFVVEWAGLVAHSYEFRADGFLVRPVVMQLTEVPIRLLSLFVTVAALAGSVFYVRRVVRVETELRRTWLLHNWHLRQMAQLAE